MKERIHITGINKDDAMRTFKAYYSDKWVLDKMKLESKNRPDGMRSYIAHVHKRKR